MRGKEGFEKRRDLFSREELEGLPYVEAETSARGVLREEGKLASIKSVYELSKEISEEE